MWEISGGIISYSGFKVHIALPRCNRNFGVRTTGIGPGVWSWALWAAFEWKGVFLTLFFFLSLTSLKRFTDNYNCLPQVASKCFLVDLGSKPELTTVAPERPYSKQYHFCRLFCVSFSNSRRGGQIPEAGSNSQITILQWKLSRGHHSSTTY